jgi:methyl-accepting chemotaxis protein
VGETLEGMFILEKKVGAIADQIVHLSERASQIGSISQLVSDLANQTNMLALNSSVEAVRAGEHGKGFSVVANEIRKFADQSQRSAEKINFLVSEIQSAINSTVMVTEEGTKTVTTGVQIAKRTDQAFAGVADAVNKVVLNNQQISLNLKQQVDGIQQVVQAMDAINKGAKETASGISQTKVGTQQLNEAALTLEQKV